LTVTGWLAQSGASSVASASTDLERDSRSVAGASSQALAEASAAQAAPVCESDDNCTDQSKPKCCCEQRFAGYMCLCQRSCDGPN